MTIESVVNSPLTFVVSGPSGVPLTDSALYLNGVISGVAVTTVQIGATNCWKITFTPNATGIFSYYAFGAIQLQTQAVAKSVQTFLANIEDEALGSWTWNKQTGLLTILRQSGVAMATHNVVDNQTTASRERVS